MLNFIRRFTLLDDDSQDETQDAVTLLTVHASKGLEYPVVFQIGLEKGLFPHDRSLEENSLEEERRLFYVSITRAKQHYIMSYCKTRWRFDMKEKKRKPLKQFKSPFIFEIKKEFIEETTSDEYFKPLTNDEAIAELDKIMQMFK
jgi:superfamily I DNA/RNA helicase